MWSGDPCGRPPARCRNAVVIRKSNYFTAGSTPTHISGDCRPMRTCDGNIAYPMNRTIFTLSPMHAFDPIIYLLPRAFARGIINDDDFIVSRVKVLHSERTQALME